MTKDLSIRPETMKQVEENKQNIFQNTGRDCVCVCVYMKCTK